MKVPPPPARPPIANDWYRDFINAMLSGEHFTWFAKLLVYGELLIGAAAHLRCVHGNRRVLRWVHELELRHGR